MRPHIVVLPSAVRLWGG